MIPLPHAVNLSELTPTFSRNLDANRSKKYDMLFRFVLMLHIGNFLRNLYRNCTVRLYSIWPYLNGASGWLDWLWQNRVQGVSEKVGIRDKFSSLLCDCNRLYSIFIILFLYFFYISFSSWGKGFASGGQAVPADVQQQILFYSSLFRYFNCTSHVGKKLRQ